MEKAGANRQEINQIIRMANDGIDSGKIAKSLNINEKVVKSFMAFDPLKFQQEQQATARKAAIELEEKRLLAEAGARIAVEEGRKKGKL